MLSRPVNPNQAFRIHLGAPDENGLRLPVGDISLPTEAPPIDNQALIELFQPEATNTSQVQPLVLVIMPQSFLSLSLLLTACLLWPASPPVLSHFLS